MDIELRIISAEQVRHVSWGFSGGVMLEERRKVGYGS